MLAKAPQKKNMGDIFYRRLGFENEENDEILDNSIEMEANHINIPTVHERKLGKINGQRHFEEIGSGIDRSSKELDLKNENIIGNRLSLV